MIGLFIKDGTVYKCLGSHSLSGENYICLDESGNEYSFDYRSGELIKFDDRAMRSGLVRAVKNTYRSKSERFKLFQKGLEHNEYLADCHFLNGIERALNTTNCDETIEKIMRL